MTAYENPILALLAFVVLAAVIFVTLKFYKEILLPVVVVTGGCALLFGGVVVLVTIGAALYEEYTAKQCLTAHERRARAERGLRRRLRPNAQ